MHTLNQDLRYALRQLRKAPAFAITAILTLALGIGANTAIFSLIDQALLRSLPVRDPQSLVVLEGTGKAWEGHASNHGGDPEAYFSYPMYRDLRDKNQVFEGLIATAPADVDFTRAGSSELAEAELVSGNYFTLLGVQPAVGRLFTQSEDQQKDGNPVAVMSFDYWKAHVGADPRIVGETVSINDHPFQIIGVAAPRFHSALWGQQPALFVPMSMIGQILIGKDKRLTDHTDKWMNIMGRLKPGVGREQAEVAMAPLWHALRANELKALGTKSKRFTDDYLTNSRMLVLPGARGFSYDRNDFQAPLIAVMAMAILVLLIAGINVASLLLVRAASRLSEFSLRFALGAEKRRIIQQLLLEGILIGVGGGVAGVVLAAVAIRALVHQLASNNAAAPFSTGIDSRLLVFNFTIAVLVSVLFSVAPALQILRPNLSAVLGQRSTTGTGAMLHLRRVIVCLQIGLSIVLLVGAGLFVRTMQKLRAVDVGFNTAHLVTFSIRPKLAGYTPAAIPALDRRIEESLSRIPGVLSVAATDDPELADTDRGGNVTVAGYTAAPDEDFDVEEPSVNTTFFSTMQVPLLAGRYFTEADDINHPHVAIVNESFAKHFCGSAQACLGKQMGDGGGDHVKLDTQIVGVVRDAKHSGVRDAVRPTYFAPLQQSDNPEQIVYYLRTYADPSQTISTVHGTIQQLDSKLALDSLRTMDAQIEENLADTGTVMVLAVSFGMLAALLAGVGIYGVLAYATAQRTREIGIRIALGSSRLGVARIILADVLALAGISIAVALPAAYGLTHLVQSQLFGVSPADPLTLIGAVLLVGIVALIAALLPAQRAATIDPMQALRTE